MDSVWSSGFGGIIGGASVTPVRRSVGYLSKITTGVSLRLYEGGCCIREGYAVPVKCHPARVRDRWGPRRECPVQRCTSPSGCIDRSGAVSCCC